MEITITCAFRTSKSFLCYLFWPNVYSAIRMFANVDLSHPDVRSEYFRWAEWLADQLPLGGL